MTRTSRLSVSTFVGVSPGPLLTDHACLIGSGSLERMTEKGVVDVECVPPRRWDFPVRRHLPRNHEGWGPSYPASNSTSTTASRRQCPTVSETHVRFLRHVTYYWLTPENGECLLVVSLSSFSLLFVRLQLLLLSSFIHFVFHSPLSLSERFPNRKFPLLPTCCDFP